MTVGITEIKIQEIAVRAHFFAFCATPMAFELATDLLVVVYFVG